MEYKLGKLPPKRDTRTLMLSDYLSGALPTPPPNVGWSSHITHWPMDANDRLGDCTIAGVSHAIQQWTSVAQAPVVLTDEQVIEAYSEITGYTPSDPNSDQGAVELDVLKYWRNTGIAGHKIDAFAAIHPKSVTEIKDSIWFFGNVYLGLALPKSIDGQRVWSVTNGPDAEPGSLGGHCTLGVAADRYGLVMVTWGKLQRATWDWMATYCDEAYAILSRDWITSSGSTPGGVLLASLQHDLRKISNA